jgi:hypothetical protein
MLLFIKYREFIGSRVVYYIGEAVHEEHNRDHYEHEADEYPRDGVDAFLETGGRGLVY